MIDGDKRIEPDDVDAIQAAWARERPGIPVASIGVITRVWRIAKLLDDDRRATMARLGMDVPTRNLLSTLRRAGTPYALTASEVARRAGVTAGAVSQWAAAGEAAGFVTRHRGVGGDGRTVEIRLTDAGRARIDAVVDELLRHEDGLVDGLAAGDLEELAGLLRRWQRDLTARARTR